jgi:hypothetical protein
MRLSSGTHPPTTTSEGGSRWTPGKHVQPDAKATLDKKLSDAEFFAKNEQYFNQPDRPEPGARILKLKIFAVGWICDELESVYGSYLDNSKEFKRRVDHPVNHEAQRLSKGVTQLYYDTLQNLLTTEINRR